MKYNVAVIPGDGIGPDVTKEAVKVLNVIAERFKHEFIYTEVCAGGCAIDQFGEPLPANSLEICKRSDAVLLGAVGGPSWDHLSGEKRPERALLGLRQELNLYANLRPCVLYPALKHSSPLKEKYLESGIDLIVVRELTGGIYFGNRGSRETDNGKAAFDEELYHDFEVKRIAKTAFDLAMKRKKKLVNVDKANVLESSRFWRSIVCEVAKNYPEVFVEHLYVDNAAMQLLRRPGDFDVLLTNNIFGDILSDEASQITGSIGIIPSASINDTNMGMYEPIHGSAPDIAGKNLANPIAAILSAAMMLRWSFHLEKEALAIEKAVNEVLHSGYRTADLKTETDESVGTAEMGDLICAQILF